MDNYIALNGWTYCGFGGERRPREFIDWAAGKGLDGVELTVSDCLSLDTTREEAVKIASYARRKGIGLRTLGSGFGWNKWLCSDDEAERTEACELVAKYMRLAKWIGAETVLVIPGATRVAWDSSHREVSYKKAWECATASIAELSTVAESFGVNLALENAWNRFLVSPMEWKLFLDQFDSSRVGIYLDVGNCCLTGRPGDYVELLGSRIKAVHLKNFSESDSAGGLHGFGDDLFSGVVDFARLFAAFGGIGYDGPYTVEMIPFSRLPDLVLPDTALAERMAAQIGELKKLAARTQPA